MYVLYRDAQSGKGSEYQIAAGSKYSVAKTLSARGKATQEQDRILEVTAADQEVVKRLKADEELKEMVGDLQIKQNLDKFKKLLILKMLSFNSCDLYNFKVCRECGKMVDMKSNIVIGNISMKSSEIKSILQIEQDWACEDCRLEFSLFSWRESSVDKFENFFGKRREYKDKFMELLRGDLQHVRSIVKISPTVDDYKVICRILEDIRKVQGEVSNYTTGQKENFYKNIVLQSFLAYHSPSKITKAVKACERCGRLWKDKKELGGVSIDFEKIQQALDYDTGWVCYRCEEIPILSLYTLEKHRSLEYYVDMNGEKTEFEIFQPGNSYVNTYVSLELFCKDTQLNKSILNKLRNKPVNIDKRNILTTDFSKEDLLRLIIKIFVKLLTKSKDYSLCSKCNRIYNSSREELGYFWSEKNLISSIGEHGCRNHELRNILYWNMTGWKTLEKVTSAKNQILHSADVVCLTETHLMEVGRADVEEFFPERIAVHVGAEKRAVTGRASGGLMLLIKKNIKCQLTRLEYSNKGVFEMIKFPEECLVAGGIYWRPESGENESLEDWIKELDNFLGVNNAENVKFIIGGDFNGRIKTDDSYCDEGMLNNCAMAAKRKSADPTGNKRGRLLLAVMKKHKLVLCNGRTKSDKEGRFTCRTVNGESVVDYVWVSAALVQNVEDMEVLDIHSTSSDYHRGLLLRLRNGEPTSRGPNNGHSGRSKTPSTAQQQKTQSSGTPQSQKRISQTHKTTKAKLK